MATRDASTSKKTRESQEVWKEWDNRKKMIKERERKMRKEIKKQRNFFQSCFVSTPLFPSISEFFRNDF